jgi:acyl-CoA thioester hydrolase
MPKPKLIETRERYSLFSVVTTRFHDNDVFGHINNAVYNVWMDTAVTQFFRAQEPGLPEGKIVPIAAETQMTFHRSISHPAEVETGFRVDRIGNRSVTCGVGIFSPGHAEAAAWGHMVHVWVAKETNRAVVIPDEIRRRLESALLREE